MHISVMRADGYTQFIENDAEIGILEKVKSIGNDHFRAKDYKKAVQAYQQCINMGFDWLDWLVDPNFSQESLQR